MARAALGGWLLPLLFALFATFTATPAMAQEPPKTVVVLDFGVASGLDPLLGRKAADGLAVELQRSGDYEVVTRQRVEDAVGQQAGLQPPFNDTAQIRLAQAVGASGVFSGRVVGVELTPGRAARVRLETKQLDASTGDYVNGTQVTETTEQKLQDVPNEILVDEAINKSVFSAVRSMRQTALPEGAVLNTTADDVELSIGTRNGVVVGQRYSVLRDVFNKSKQITERLKIGELKIARTESDQSIGVLSAGGAAGVRTGDRIRQIFVPVTYPMTTGVDGGSVTPVTAPPIRSAGESGIKGFAKNGSKGLAGIFALAGLIGLAGLGGGSNSTAPGADIVRNPVVEKPLPGGDYGYFSTANFQPLSAQLSFNAGFTGFSISKKLQTESVVGYAIFRGTSPSFSADVTNMQGFLDGRNASSSSANVTFADPSPSTPTRRLITITATGGNTNNNNGGGTGTGDDDDDTSGTSGSAAVQITDTEDLPGVDTFNQSPDTISFDFTQRPVVIGQTYYYRVARVTAERVSSSSSNSNNNNNGNTGNNGNNGNNTGDDDDTTNGISVRLQPALSRISKPTGGFTFIVQPKIIATPGGYTTDNFSVRVNFDPSFYSTNLQFNLPTNINVATGTDQVRVQVSTSNTFTENTTFTSSDLAPNNIGFGEDLVVDLGDIRIPSTASIPYVPNVTPLFVRVLLRNSFDQVPTFRISPTLPIGTATGLDSTSSSRFLASATAKHGGGVNILGNRNSRLQGGSSGPVRVLRPQ